MWGSGFGRSRDIKAQDVERAKKQRPGYFLSRRWAVFAVRRSGESVLWRRSNAIKENTGLPLLPSWNDKSGIWAISPMTTAGASLFLKEFLETVLGDEGAAKYGSLSGKPTERKLR